MGMEMEMPDSATFISGDICFFLWRGFLDRASSICVRMRVAETCKKNYKTYEENQKNCFYYIIVRVDLHLWFWSFTNSFFNAFVSSIFSDVISECLSV